MKIPLKQYWTLLINYLRPQWPMSVALAVLLLANIALQLVNPQIMRTFIDVATTTATSPETAAVLLRASLLFIGVGLAQQIVSLTATYFGETVGWKSTNALRADLADHCLRLDMSFHNSRTPGEMIERVEGTEHAIGTTKDLVLHDISFHLRPGTVLGLLGRTGSGKTTLTRLVFRLYDPDQGGVFLGCNGDGLLDVRQIPLLQLRRRVGMVTQNIQLFNASVRDNLTFFDRDIPDARILQVLRDLELWTWTTFRSLPTTSAG